MKNWISAAPVSLNSAPLTCQFFLEDHAVRHSYHHLARIKAALALRERQQIEASASLTAAS